jgi:hypothetical protein
MRRLLDVTMLLIFAAAGASGQERPQPTTNDPAFADQVDMAAIGRVLEALLDPWLGALIAAICIGGYVWYRREMKKIERKYGKCGNGEYGCIDGGEVIPFRETRMSQNVTIHLGGLPHALAPAPPPPPPQIIVIPVPQPMAYFPPQQQGAYLPPQQPAQYLPAYHQPAGYQYDQRTGQPQAAQHPMVYPQADQYPPAYPQAQYPPMNHLPAQRPRGHVSAPAQQPAGHLPPAYGAVEEVKRMYEIARRTVCPHCHHQGIGHFSDGCHTMVSPDQNCGCQAVEWVPDRVQVVRKW